MHIRIFFEALFIIVIWEYAKLVNRSWSFQIMEYYAAIKNDTMDSYVCCSLLLAASTFLIHHTFSTFSP